MNKKQALPLLILIIMFFHPMLLTTSTSSQTYYNSPSYLLLNNWDNQSIWIVTGIKVPKPLLNGFPIFPPSIRNLYVGKLGILNFSVNINITSEDAYLTLNNSVVISGNEGNITIMTPPYTPYILLTFNIVTRLTITVLTNATIYKKGGEIVINMSKPRLPVFLLSNISSYFIQNHEIIFNISKGIWFLEISVNASPYSSVSALINLNNKEVSQWLNKSRIPKLPNTLLKEYYLSLLLIKDDQNPYLGTFAASPSPIYLYSWVRDSAFSAIALQQSGHYNSALKYWLWMTNTEQLQPGVWYTRYNFYNGDPDSSFGIPELDSIGLYEIGVYDYYNLTHNTTFLKLVLPRINESVEYQIQQIENDKYHLIPPDLSVWEDRLAYHFWTEAINDLGLSSVVKIYKALGLNYTLVLKAEKLLNESILKYFWDNNSFASALGTSVLFENGKSEEVLTPEPPSIDSATLLPIDMGYLPYNSNYSVENFDTVVKTLTRYGGLARFPDDLYHYSEYLYDATAPSPPWIITTLFEAWYLEGIGKYNEVESILFWAYNHSQHGLLPEAVNPSVNDSYPLPTTSPLTWSSAMFVIVSLHYKQEHSSVLILIFLVIVIALIPILYYLIKKFYHSQI
ncbi:glycoside hydrolase family 15 protein [Sulfurisphaera ohwakuensis]|uniref:GH15 family glucan-1,4-alpha-glucosidase n=1 Tax=Sulfurisphaera ohwakuensis TaxID=69656 RepID=A0A650CFY9_SULOH|nr:glycoside hydrolase family 15 protein [Sulfurisphaera ohwakuensis]MBB5254058.1 GH15 family glucan-1,4-alpha-glucosidase [Sulfurisphaera ohwakuensis]QGR16658.1 glycoside hydrolase [Sulfurisphaera ohwakuensis]